MPSAAAMPARASRVSATETTNSTAGPGVKHSTVSKTQNASQVSSGIEATLPRVEVRGPARMGSRQLGERVEDRARRAAEQRALALRVLARRAGAESGARAERGRRRHAQGLERRALHPDEEAAAADLEPRLDHDLRRTQLEQRLRARGTGLRRERAVQSRRLPQVVDEGFRRDVAQHAERGRAGHARAAYPHDA